MKVVGFIKELDNFAWSSPLQNQITEMANSADLIERLISYVEKGRLVMGWMGYFIDLETNEHIAPHAYLSDGTWIWPSYYAYYLRKYRNLKLDEEFIRYLEARNSNAPEEVFDEMELQRKLIEKMKEI